MTSSSANTNSGPDPAEGWRSRVPPIEDQHTISGYEE
jgi:hypothetical protein